MEIIKPKVELLPCVFGEGSTKSDYCKMVNRVAKIARLCYRSEQSSSDPEKANDKDYEFVHNLYEKGHTSVFEHVRIDFDAKVLIPSWSSYNTAKKLVKLGFEESKYYNKARRSFCEIISTYVNRTSVDKESIDVHVFHFSDGPRFIFTIHNINLRELIVIFDRLTLFIGSRVAKRYCRRKYGTLSFWTTPTLFDIERAKLNHAEEFILLSILVALWRAIYVKLSDTENGMTRKNIFETISNKQEFYYHFDTTMSVDGESIRARFNDIAKKMISDMKSDAAYESVLESAMSFSASDKPYNEIGGVKISDTLECYTFYIETNRGVLAELTRHRCLSPTVESTRYVNYSKTDKYGEMCFTDQVSLYEPSENDSKGVVKKNRKKQRMLRKMYAKEEKMYNKLIKNGFTPQEARNVLPNGLVSRMYVTGTLHEWLHFVELRSDKSAHPDIRVIADQIKDYLP